MKFPLQNILFILLTLSFFRSNSQESKIIETFDTSFQDNWEFFDLKEIIKVKVIKHVPAYAFCGPIATASMTIVEKSDGEVIRVLDLCNMDDNFEVNSYIFVLPEKKPDFYVSPPFMCIQNEKTNSFESITKEFDTKVLETTYGSIVTN
ncbi:hypothetical protein [Patiriisocius hiemis]|uniref:Uncharacterized protein n=1 Tax=Patiriisocius hiemis TaxID=3075604 RepID=A0ABU2Y8Q9_9FLAO|nr:hypothetical protein [Constantimarinum sp. W242]MDT0554554.1 hypothetical protein [Constantimarinum sp. W242]